MIIIKAQGGLGNQLFQFALYKKFEKRRQEASIVAYNAGVEWYRTGKEIEMATKLYQSNKDFLRGYKDALNEEINSQTKDSVRK